MTTITDLIDRVEAVYDALPRAARTRTEECGPFTLFLRDGAGWPFYARPTRGFATLGRPGHVTVDMVRDVLARQRELDVPQAIEWVDEMSPGLLDVAREAGLSVLLAPLMVLDQSRRPDPVEVAPAEIRFLSPDATDFVEVYAASGAVAEIAFNAGHGASGGTSAGPAERDAAVRPVDPQALESTVVALREGRIAEAVLIDGGDGVVARGAYQSARGGAEIVGVATLPARQRRGYGAALSAALAHRALAAGNDLVFLSAASETVARVYARIGFVRIGTACIGSVENDTADGNAATGGDAEGDE